MSSQGIFGNLGFALPTGLPSYFNVLKYYRLQHCLIAVAPWAVGLGVERYDAAVVAVSLLQPL